jgi:hypothetical protein
MHNVHKYIPAAVVAIFVICFSFLVATKINLVTADLGRHIENGRLILTGSPEVRSAIFHTNHYSYVHSDFPFINHHWGIGVLFYVIWTVAGFNGLSLFYIFSSVLMLVCCLVIAIKKGNVVWASLAALILMPLLMSRREIRPEVITYLLSIFFYGVMWWQQEKKFSIYWLLSLIPLQLLWTNIHIGFFFGEAVVGLFFFQALIAKEWKRAQFLGMLLIGVVLVTIITPNGIAGALYPLSIFNNYGYTLYENQSVFTLENLGFYSVEFAVYKCMLILTWLSAGIYIVRTKDWMFIFNPLTLIMVLVSYLSFTGIRNLILFALFAVPYVSYIYARFFPKPITPIVRSGVLGCIALVLLMVTTNTVTTRAEQGIGLLPGVEGSAIFFRDNNLKGPIFNDYDNGSFIEYEIQSKDPVFVDNRPEAYPASFFSDIYINSQQNEEAWKALNEQYGFNVIWFHRNDLTPWAQTFLNARVVDTAWSLVYLDPYSVIFIKRTEQNKALIEKYEIKFD